MLNSADIITSTISQTVKLRINAEDFDDGYSLLIEVKELYRPFEDAEFMRLIKAYYSVDFIRFKNMMDCLADIRHLEDRIRATKVVLPHEKQTLICLSLYSNRINT